MGILTYLILVLLSLTNNRKTTVFFCSDFVGFVVIQDLNIPRIDKHIKFLISC